MTRNYKRIASGLILAIQVLLFLFGIYGIFSDTNLNLDDFELVLLLFSIILAVLILEKLRNRLDQEDSLYSINYQAMRTAKKRNPFNGACVTGENER